VKWRHNAAYNAVMFGCGPPQLFGGRKSLLRLRVRSNFRFPARRVVSALLAVLCPATANFPLIIEQLRG